jgi:hypothetical protein
MDTAVFQSIMDSIVILCGYNELKDVLVNPHWQSALASFPPDQISTEGRI